MKKLRIPLFIILVALIVTGIIIIPKIKTALAFKESIYTSKYG
jgi:hypothetical protein